MSKEHIVTKLLAQAVADGAFPSAAAAFGVGDDVLYMEAFGKANLATRFDMASVSKILVPTMLALQALEAGKITLYDTLERYFKTPPDKKDITILNLMTHTSGIPDHIFVEEHAKTPAQAVEAILAQPLVHKPGTAPFYSCLGYITLGKIVEMLYAQPLDVLADEQIFKPLGMQHTGFCPTGDNIAPTEMDAMTGKPWTGIVHDENARFLGGVSGNAGVFSDIRDMAKYCSMLATGGMPIITPATLDLAIQNYTAGQAQHRGLGFHLSGTPQCFFGDLFPACSFGHTGFTGTSVVVDPTTGRWACLLTNRVHPTRENDKHLRMRRVFHNACYAIMDRTDNCS